MRKPTEQNDINCLLTARLPRECQAVHCVDFDSLRTNFFYEVVGIFCRARDDRHGVDLLRVCDDLSAVFKTAQPTRRLQNFKRNDKICLSFVDDGRVNFFAEAYISYDGATALAHAVHFRNFYVEALVQKQVPQNFAGEKRALPADADDDYIFCLHGSSLLRGADKCFLRTKLTANAATDALSLVDDSFAVLHADSGTTDFHARLAADTFFRVDFERRFVLDGFKQGARSARNDDAWFGGGKFFFNRGVAFFEVVRVDDAHAINSHCFAQSFQVNLAGGVALDV